MPSEDMAQEKKTNHQDSASPKGKSNMENTWNYDIIDFLNEQMKHIDPNNVNLPDKEGDPATTPSRLINSVDLQKNILQWIRQQLSWFQWHISQTST